MRPRSTAILAALAAMTLLVAVASPTGKKTVNLFEPMIAGSATLQPGEYIVEWNGPGPDVEVSFSQGKTTIVRIPATLAAAQNPHDISVTYRVEESGAHSLSRLKQKVRRCTSSRVMLGAGNSTP